MVPPGPLGASGMLIGVFCMYIYLDTDARIALRRMMLKPFLKSFSVTD